VVLVNQILGPILFKIAVRRVGEAGKAQADGAFDVDADIPTAMVLGSTPDAMAVATRLLKQRWHVVMVAPTQADAAAAKAAVAKYALATREAEDKGKNIASVLVEQVVAKPVANVRSLWGRLQDRFAGAGAGTSTRNVGAGAGAAAGAHMRMEDEEAGSPTPVGSAAGGKPGAAGGGIEMTGAAAAASSHGSAPAAAAAAAAPEQHHDDHEHGHRWLIEDHFEAVALVLDDAGVAAADNPFLQGSAALAAVAAGAGAAAAAGAASTHAEGAAAHKGHHTLKHSTANPLQGATISAPAANDAPGTGGSPAGGMVTGGVLPHSASAEWDALPATGSTPSGAGTGAASGGGERFTRAAGDADASGPGAAGGADGSGDGAGGVSYASDEWSRAAAGEPAAPSSHAASASGPTAAAGASSGSPTRTGVPPLSWGTAAGPSGDSSALPAQSAAAQHGYAPSARATPTGHGTARGASLQEAAAALHSARGLSAAGGAPGSTIAGAGAAAAGGSVVGGTDYTFSKLVALVQSSSRTLQAVAAMLPSDAANLASCSLIERIIAAAPRRSHLHSVRLVASCRDPAWAGLFESIGVLPIHEFSLAAAAASRLITVAPSKPTVLLPGAANNDELAKAVLKGVVEGAHYWDLADAAPTQLPGAGGVDGSDAAGTGARARGRSAGGAGLLAGSQQQYDGIIAAGKRASLYRRGVGDAAAADGVDAGAGGGHRGGAGGRMVASMLRHAGVEAEEVPAWERDNYLAQIAGITEETSGLQDLEGRLAKGAKRRKQDELEMYGSMAAEAAEAEADAAEDAAVASAGAHGHGGRHHGGGARGGQYWP